MEKVNLSFEIDRKTITEKVKMNEKTIKGVEKKEYYRNYMKDYYRKNKDKVREWQDKYKAKHLDEIREYSHLYYDEQKGNFIYVILNYNLEWIRIGSCNNLSRLNMYKYDGIVPTEEIYKIIYMEMPSREVAFYMEGKLIEAHEPKYNKNCVDIDKYREYVNGIILQDAYSKLRNWDWKLYKININL